MSNKVNIQITINGKALSDQVKDTRTLADYLHEYQGLTGTKVCCGIGICRACSVAVKRPGADTIEAVRACITPLSSLQGASVTTIEGLQQGDQLHPLQEALLKHFSFQCGFSTSGFLMGAYALLDKLKKHPIPKEQVESAILEAVGDNICRCTGYTRYYAAIKEVVLSTPGLVLN